VESVKQRIPASWNPFGISLLAAALVTCGDNVDLGQQEADSDLQSDEGWISLFNGHDLAGWEVMGDNQEAFYVNEGVIECNGRGGGWIRCTREVSNFALRLEYKISPGGNSGVFLRSQGQGHPAYTGFEVQILDDHGRPPDKHTSGAIYDIVIPMVNMSKPPGEWNEFIITCDGPLVTVVMNGVKIVDTDFDLFTEPRGKFPTPYADLPRTGFIGMQDHSSYVWFRNIRLKPLP
jgi:hypothetical protein